MILKNGAKTKPRNSPPEAISPRGLGTKANLRDWSDYARTNSFSQAGSKAQSRHDLDQEPYVSGAG